jgi:hypothetical protein
VEDESDTDTSSTGLQLDSGVLHYSVIFNKAEFEHVCHSLIYNV